MIVGWFFRSSVCRASMADKENFVKIKDQQLEKIKILNAEKLPIVPQTPNTPTPLEEKSQNVEGTKVEDSDVSSVAPAAAPPSTIAAAETASMTSEGEDDSSSATNTSSSAGQCC